MKYLVKNKIPEVTPYVSVSYNGNVSYMPISGSGLPSTIHAEEDGLYIEKNNRIWPMTHPDLSTQPSILPQRFGKLPIYEELIAVENNYYQINRTNIIQASAFNETNYSPITIENGIVTTKLNFKPDYLLVQYFGEMDNYYYINNSSNGPKSLIGNFLMKDLTLKDINDVSDMSQVLGIYIGDNAITGERLFVTAESLLNTATYKFRASANTLPNNFQSSDFYTSETNVAGQENKVFAGRIPFAISGTVNDITVDWGGESNTEAWLYLINKYTLDLSDYPALEYASTHNGYLMGAGEESLFVTNHDAIWNAYTKLTEDSGSFYSWGSSFGCQTSTGNSGQAYLGFHPDYAYSDYSYGLGRTTRVCLLITLSKKYTQYFDWITYKWCKGSNSTMTKYCTDSSYGYNGFTDATDAKTELDLEDDAAYVNWGPAWRMPSTEQFQELYNSNYTTTEWTTQNGVYGRKITSKANGNSIFLPAAGYRNDSSFSRAGSDGYYWSRTLYSGYPNDARSLRFGSNYIEAMRSSRCYGRSVRPVCIDSSQANHEYVDLGLPSGTLWAKTNIGASSPEEYGLYFAWGETEGYQ